MSYALVTGASKGIGLAIARQLAAKGKNVLLVARNRELLELASKEIETSFNVKSQFLVLDLSGNEAPQQLLNWCRENHFEVDVLVNNAGYGLSGLFESYPLEEHLNMMQLNMNTLVRLIYLFLPVLKASPKGYIMNIASSAAYQATPYLGLYSATKSFVLLFSRALSHELKGSHVSVTCISPGATDTEFVDRARVGKKGRDLAKKFHMKPETVAAMAVDAMYAGKTEIVTGFVNKLGVFLAWLLPKKLVENSAAKIYE